MKKLPIKIEALPAEPLVAPIPTLETLMDLVSEYMTPETCETVADAYAFATEAHEGARRRSGEPYIVHPLITAMLLASMHMDPTTVLAGILHDTVEDTAASVVDLETKFGPGVAHLVDGVTKVARFSRQQISRSELRDAERSKKGEQQMRRQAENIKKMFMAMAEDPRVIIVKLADRLHNM